MGRRAARLGVACLGSARRVRSVIAAPPGRELPGEDRSRLTRGQGVLEELAALHHPEDPVRVLEHGDVLERVAVDHDEVGELAFA